ncbi:MAG TPA: hypothetical protein VLV81_07345 [Acidimicrobiia bacterium]|nr:hypothetical protein [Acidimicrobiia bacterium]
MRVRIQLLAVATVTVFALGSAPTVAGAKLPPPRKNHQQQASALFVVNASGGTATSPTGSTFTLDLSGVNPDAVFFTDRPARDTGVLGVDRMLQVLRDGQRTPPNGVVDVSGGQQGPFAVAVELTNPSYDQSSHTLHYQAHTLKKTKGTRLTHYDRRLDTQLPGQFGRAALFIDTSPFGSTNFCGVTVANYTEQNVTLNNQSKWGTDTWDPSPPNNGFILGLVANTYWQSDGGFARGCGNSTTWQQADGTTFNTSVTDPYGNNPNSISCTSSDPTGHPCHLDPSSVTRGPDAQVTFYFCDFARQSICPGQ